MSETTTPESILRDMLRGMEEAIRGLDIKTEIAMLCFVLSVEAAHPLIDLGELRTTRPLLSGLLFVLFIAAVVAYMLVLFPAHNPRINNSNSAADPSKAIRDVYFVPDPESISTDVLVRSVTAADHAHRLAYEILKLSAIRNAKRKRFVGALCITLAFYVLLLLVDRGLNSGSEHGLFCHRLSRPI